MAKLKLGMIEDDKPVKLAVELPAAVHRDLVAYGEVHARETGQGVVDPSRLVGPMLARFMATDRTFAKLRRESHFKEGGVIPPRRAETQQTGRPPGLPAPAATPAAPEPTPPGHQSP